jgi:hypothetical protein
MNRYLILVCLVLTGCPLKPATVTTQAKVVDDSGNNRLLLRFIEEPMPGHGEEETAFDFHSLVWRQRERRPDYRPTRRNAERQPKRRRG